MKKLILSLMVGLMLIGGVVNVYGQQHIGGYGVFDGIDDYINTNALFNSSTFTASAWINHDSLTGFGDAILGNTTYNVNGAFIKGYVMRYTQQWPNWVEFHAGTYQAGDPAAWGFVPSLAWTHVAISYDGTFLRIFTDGMLADALFFGSPHSGAPWTYNPPTRSLLIGRDWTNIVNFHGFIDEVMVYNRALLDVEIDQIYQLGIQGVRSDITNGLVGYWPMDTDFNDYSGNNLNGVAFGGVLTTGYPYLPPNALPVSNAGPNRPDVLTDDIATTIIQGSASDADAADLLQCRWSKGATILKNWFLAEGVGSCPLDLSTVSLDIGIHTLTLEVDDGLSISSDEMILTINNSPPHADAGENVTILSQEMSTTTLTGIISDSDLATGDVLKCRWVIGTTALQGWFYPTTIGGSGSCPLDLSTVSLGIGTHTLRLEADDCRGRTIYPFDSMILTIENSAPVSAPGGAGTYELNSVIELVGDVSDFDGNSLDYEWLEGANVLCSGTIATVAGGTPVSLTNCDTLNVISSILGEHTIELKVTDNVNSPVSGFITIIIDDSTAPLLAPFSSDYILWPPNHVMVDIVIEANAVDNSGLPVTLSATASSNELDEGLGDGDMPNDIIQPSIDQTTGVISLQLRRERSGSGTGRIYSIVITATDQSGNSSEAIVKINVPHDKGKKK